MTNTTFCESDLILTDYGNVGNFTELSNEINNINDTLKLTKNYTFDNSTDNDYCRGIVINKSITIDGQGFTIDGNNLSRIFYVNASNITLKNIIFQNANVNESTAFGGAIFWNGDDGNIVNCSFYNNTVGLNGGAIYWNGVSGNLINSTFQNSYSRAGGAILWNASYGNIDNCIFINNSAMTAAGAIYWNAGEGSVKNSRFEQNNATLNSGVIYSSNIVDLDIINCIFNNNYIQLGAGGAICYDNVSGNIVNSTFSDNFIGLNYGFLKLVYGEGGAVSWRGDCVGNIVNCIFKNNNAQLGTSIYVNSTVNIYNSTFSDESFSKTIYDDGNLYLSNNTLNNNTIIINNGTITSKVNVIFSNNSIICESNGEIIINGTIIDDNNNLIIFSSLNVTLDESYSSNANFTNHGIFSAIFSPDIAGNYTISINTTNKLTNANITTANLIVSGKPMITLEVISAVYPNATFNISSSADGIYIVSVDDKNNTVNITNGYSIVSFSNLTSGNHNVTVNFDGNDVFIKTNATFNFTVLKSDNYLFTITSNNITYGANASIIITLIDDARGNVTVSLGDYNNTLAINNSTVTFDISNLSIGNYDVTVIYSGDDNYVGSLKNNSINVISSIDSNNIKRGYNSGCDFNATFYNIDGSVLSNSTVQFKINSNIYNITTDGNGVGVFDKKLSKGNYNITSINLITGENVTNTLIIVDRIQNNKNLIMDYYDGSTFSVLIYGIDGNVVGKGVKVTFKVNSKTYIVETNEKGYALLKITEIPKTYKITTSYAGQSVKNIIIVKQILKATKVSIKKSFKKLILKATLKSSNGKVLKNKKITFKFKGKKYTSKTNTKGVAKVTIKKSVIKKLKKSKKYAFTVAYLKDTVKSYVLVKK